MHLVIIQYSILMLPTLVIYSVLTKICTRRVHACLQTHKLCRCSPHTVLFSFWRAQHVSSNNKQCYTRTLNWTRDNTVAIPSHLHFTHFHPVSFSINKLVDGLLGLLTYYTTDGKKEIFIHNNCGA